MYSNVMEGIWYLVSLIECILIKIRTLAVHLIGVSVCSSYSYFKINFISILSHCISINVTIIIFNMLYRKYILTYRHYPKWKSLKITYYMLIIIAKTTLCEM